MSPLHQQSKKVQPEVSRCPNLTECLGGVKLQMMHMLMKPALSHTEWATMPPHRKSSMRKKLLICIQTMSGARYIATAMRGCSNAWLQECLAAAMRGCRI
eukprot:1161516-Pelagomonas_calceolata.AAC.1